MTTLSFYQKIAGHRRVTTRSAAQLTGLGISTASMALRRLEAEHLVTRIKRGAWLVGPAAGKPGALVAAAARVPYEAYVSGWSALRHHGQIQRLPEIHFGVTLGRPADVSLAGAYQVQLHHINPDLFTGYAYDSTADGLVASSEKALFDTGYFAAMNRRPMSGALPETDLKGIRWSKLQGSLRRIPNPSIGTAVERSLRKLPANNMPGPKIQRATGQLGRSQPKDQGLSAILKPPGAPFRIEFGR